MTRMTRRFAPLALALGLLTAAPAVVRAQEEPPAAEGESKGRPFDGYFVTSLLACGIIFILSKSARR